MSTSPNSQILTLLSPIRGDLIPLEQVPDPVFAQKIVGDGVAFDPVEGKLHAPCDGEVTLVHSACHAVSLKTDTGLEILMHIGVDTVALNGEGFKAHTKQGDQVKSGDLLIEFDVDAVSRKVPSLMTPLLVTNPEEVSKLQPSNPGATEPGETALTCYMGDADTSEADSGPTVRSNPVPVANATGIHARPAAQLSNAAKKFTSKTTLWAGQRSANARSVVAIMGLGVRYGDELVIEASGPDSQAAIEGIEKAIRDGLGEEVSEITAAQPVVEIPEEPSLLIPRDSDPNRMNGVSAAPGHAVGTLMKIENTHFEYPETASDANLEQSELTSALEASRTDLTDLIKTLEQAEDTDKAEIMGAHLELLSDPALEEDARGQITSGASAPAGWQHAINMQVDVLEGLNNPLMQQRAADLRDVGSRVIRKLLGMSGDPMGDLPDGTILASEELTPSETAGLDPTKVRGVITTGGGATSHSAILARSMGIPMLAASDPRILDADDGIQILLNADAGQIQLNPSAEQLSQLEKQQADDLALKEASEAGAMDTAVTKDGHHVEVAANIGNVKEAAEAAARGADGIGLLRSEFLFLDRVTAPDEDDQYQSYKEMLEGIGANRPAIVRTLDVGGDKPLAYLPLPVEENPFLGERGIRIGLNRPSILRTQFRALLRAAPAGKLRIMLPMIASLNELRLARQVLDEERAKLKGPEVELGIMIEVPSAAVMADVLAQEADFFSIGTNDLTQYTLAIDRGNAALAALADNLDPSILRMIDMTCRGAKSKGKWVGVCGGMAAEKDAIPLLIGLGVDELSVGIPSVAATKYQVRQLNISECKELASQALKLNSAAEVRALLKQKL